MRQGKDTTMKRMAAAKRLLAAGCVLAGALAALQAPAQTPPPGQYPGGGSPRGGILGRPATGAVAKPQGNPQDQLEFRLVQLHNDLKLTPVQEVAWGSFSDKIRALVVDTAREHDRAFSDATLDSMKQIDLVTSSMRRRLAALEDITTVARLLYDRLTPEQRTAANPRLATIVQTAIKVDDSAASDSLAADLTAEPAQPPAAKPPKIRFGPPPAPDPSKPEVGR